MVFRRKGKHKMKNITREYLLLFNAITEAEEALRCMREKLIAAQQQAEEVFISSRD